MRKNGQKSRSVKIAKDKGTLKKGEDRQMSKVRGSGTKP
jgi:hypothetical protein